jgi:hypothetical protein
MAESPRSQLKKKLGKTKKEDGPVDCIHYGGRDGGAGLGFWGFVFWV